MATKTPVTTSGWYEHTDGTWGRYQWRAGQLSLEETVATAAEITTDEGRLAAASAAYDAARA